MQGETEIELHKSNQSDINEINSIPPPGWLFVSARVEQFEDFFLLSRLIEWRDFSTSLAGSSMCMCSKLTSQRKQ